LEVAVTKYHFWRGDRIRLRAIEQKDIEKEPEEMDTEMERSVADIPFPSSREQDREGMEGMRKREPGSDAYAWIIETLDGQGVGFIHTFECDRRVGVFKYAISIHRDHRRCGYAREAITIVLRYYFRELGYQKLISMVYSYNERSIRMHEKLGFVFEGRLRRTVYTNGRHYDTIYFGMTNEEFDLLDPPEELWEDTHYRIRS
jgi:RimJ/RimL family protein N-acetyltransferase